MSKHLTVMGVKNDPTCKGVYISKEIAVHVLYECEAYSACRFQHLDGHLTESHEFRDILVHV